MGIMEAFSKEDRTEVTFSTFYSLVKEAAKAELMMNAVKCDVPHRYIRETMTGCGEPETKEVPEEAPAMTIETPDTTVTFTKKKDEGTSEDDGREGSKHEGKFEKGPQGGGHDTTANS